MQAEILAGILAEDRPVDLTDAYDDAMSRGPNWKVRIAQSLKRAPGIAKIIERASRAA